MVFLVMKTFHAQAGPKRSVGFQVFHHLTHRSLKLLTLIRGQPRQIVQELG